MRRLDVQIPAPDGRSNGTLHLPDGDGPWPGVLVFPDAGGARETFRQMGDRLAGMGYVALIPDIYYRAGQWAPFNVATLFTDKRERARLSGLTTSAGSSEDDSGGQVAGKGGGPGGGDLRSATAWSRVSARPAASSASHAPRSMTALTGARYRSRRAALN